MLGVSVLRRCTRGNTSRVGVKSTRVIKRTCVASIGKKTVTHELPTESVSIETNVIGQLDPLRKVGIVFTCTVCQTRSAKSFSHKSYTEGTVIFTLLWVHSLSSLFPPPNFLVQWGHLHHSTFLAWTSGFTYSSFPSFSLLLYPSFIPSPSSSSSSFFWTSICLSSSNFLLF